MSRIWTFFLLSYLFDRQSSMKTMKFCFHAKVNPFSVFAEPRYTQKIVPSLYVLCVRYFMIGEKLTSRGIP